MRCGPLINLAIVKAIIEKHLDEVKAFAKLAVQTYG